MRAHSPAVSWLDAWSAASPYLEAARSNVCTAAGEVEVVEAVEEEVGDAAAAAASAVRDGWRSSGYQTGIA